MELYIDKRGTIRTITHDAQQVDFCKQLGKATTRRASFIEPENAMLRWTFHMIRRNVKDCSRLAQWTRRWRCNWRVAIVNGPTFGRYRNRQAAIDAEVLWLQKHVLGEQHA